LNAAAPENRVVLQHVRSLVLVSNIGV